MCLLFDFDLLPCCLGAVQKEGQPPSRFEENVIQWGV
jgi:hypothetical protein